MRSEQRALAGIWFVTGLACAVPAVSARAQSENDPVGVAAVVTARQEALVEATNVALGLTASRVVSLSVNPTPGASQRLVVPLDEEWVGVDLAEFSVRSPKYALKMQIADGSLVDVPAGPVRTVRGTALGHAGSVAAGAIGDDGLSLVIDLGAGRRYWMEPIVSRVAGARPGDYAVYRQQDVIPNGGACGTDLPLAAAGADSGPTAQGTPCDGSPCVAELACDADVEYFNNWGSVASVEARINLVINTTNIQYETEVGLTHQITAIIVRTAEPDPYSATASSTLLSQFRSHWLNNQGAIERDVAHLFTGKNIDGTTIGQAWTIAGICTNSAYCHAQSDCCGSLSCATDLTAHELGHLWGGVHCSCPTFTMNPSITCVNTFHPTQTIPQILSHKNSRTCLSDVAPFTAFPFSDPFASTTLDPALWTAENAVVDTLGNGEPSAPNSLHLNGTDQPSTGFMDTSGYCDIRLNYWWQRTGSAGGSPSVGEDLVVEFWSSDGSWILAAQHAGEGNDAAPFAFQTVLLPASAEHAAFRVRLRLLNAETTDHFFVDDFSITATDEAAWIAEQPIGTFACLNGTGIFTVTPGGNPPHTFQWFREGGLIPGATNNTLVVTPGSPAAFAGYSVNVTNVCSTVASDTAYLTQTFPIEIQSQPEGATISVGEAYFPVVIASGSPTYQWLKDGQIVPGATELFLSVPSATCADAGQYSVALENDCSMATSDVAMLTVLNCGQADCNGNTIPDALDIAQGTSQDCNTDTIPDECAGCTSACECNDADVCTYDGCGVGSCVHDSYQFGDVNGDGFLNSEDALCVLDTFSGVPDSPSCFGASLEQIDLAPCPGVGDPTGTGDDFINGDDALAVINAFSGIYPNAQCTCTGAP